MRSTVKRQRDECIKVLLTEDVIIDGVHATLPEEEKMTIDLSLETFYV